MRLDTRVSIRCGRSRAAAFAPEASGGAAHRAPREGFHDGCAIKRAETRDPNTRGAAPQCGRPTRLRSAARSARPERKEAARIKMLPARLGQKLSIGHALLV